jgi:hypothetical protein
MKYFETPIQQPANSNELRIASSILKKEFPNGPKVIRMTLDEKPLFNEIANHIHTSYQEVSKSLRS